MFMAPEFWSALAAIVVIDLVLAGDNAIVIALAARNLPKAVQRRAVIWGTVGAVVVRASLTVAVLWLLEVPGLMAAGGVLLAWIAYRLLAGNDNGKGHEVAPAVGFWAAMRTIVIADAVMGLDNVLAVAGAAREHPWVLVFGLVLSVVLMGIAANFIARYIERYRWIAYVGLVVIIWVAGKMIWDGWHDVAPHLV
jgi:YjbE family integral membrane protein